MDRVAILEGMLAKTPDDPMVHFMLGNEYFKAGRYADAIATITAYLARQEDEGSAYRLLAQAHERLGDRETAKAAYRQGIVQATKFHHASMVEEFTGCLNDL
ncbi:MAG: tetratricopeptide repeat protein [candidate division NC10 bacterium]|nr:tetratricopeptide repeat protein [candidate division NC10 bacterium]